MNNVPYPKAPTAAIAVSDLRFPGPVTPGVPPITGIISLSVDGESRQQGDLRQMIWSVDEIIASLSTYVALAPGDLIFTGTPSGVGRIQRGETIRGIVAGAEPIQISFEP